jgi:transglutaminase-like putative cysteine protease
VSPGSLSLSAILNPWKQLGVDLPQCAFAGLGIPARAVSACALELNPPDFHAIFEVYNENGWWLIDPTRLAPIEEIVRIGSGRDTSDIAFLTSDKQCHVLRQTIDVARAAWTAAKYAGRAATNWNRRRCHPLKSCAVIFGG